MEKINAKGLLCPKPVIITKQKLDEMEEGTVEVAVDNRVCVENLSKFAQGQGFDFDYEEFAEDDYLVTINKSKDSKATEVASDEDFTLAITSDTMGGGEEELGKILIKSFIYTVSQTKPLPKTLVFYNKGVFLTCEGSEVLDDLKAMAQEGVEIVSCGTCLDFYNLKEKLQIGEISNMYTIYEKIQGPKKNIIIR
ncbi:sulfurtransferase-like selenium metabolism protein YedF [Lagierella sp.]|uniref:sulfurtransferase-like selenium metabolism protein YedF n=1 Tax=Lagierella sp. TaxID=2849657 RepID=UPI00260CF4C5|nr:sulfurtransferase-like selenium metabolism protein YedF [Lagierella sp.]